MNWPGIATADFMRGVTGDRLVKRPRADPKAEAPPPLKVQSVVDRNLFEVDRPERFQLTTSVPHTATIRVESHRNRQSRCFQKRSRDFTGFRPRHRD